MSASEGPSTDANNQPVIDPTKNVLDLVTAAIKRQDDLRVMEADYMKQIIDLRAQERIEGFEHVELIANLRASHATELRKTEAERLDAIRLVDTTAVATAALTAEQRAATLAGQVEQTRLQFATTLATALDPIQKDVADLRRVQYEQQGQRVAQTETKGGNQWIIGVAISIVVALISISGLIVVLVSHK